MRRIRSTDPEAEARWLGLARDIATRLLAPHDVEVYLFGSRARGDARLASDIDLAIEPRGDLPASVLAKLADELEESTIPVRVELIDLRTAGERLRDSVRRDGIRWIASKSA
jgi:hypothetical protein